MRNGDYIVYYYRVDEDGAPYLMGEDRFKSFEAAFLSVKDWQNTFFEIDVEVYIRVGDEVIVTDKLVARNSLTRSLFTSYIGR